MSRSITIKMSRKDAKELGLLVCQCGWPKNNHFDFGEKKCAHSKRCKGYKERSRRGKIIK